MNRPADILSHTAHRPWPLPNGPWIMEQGWYNLLFAHWEAPLAQMRSRVPVPLELDTYNGTPWVSITPFQLTVRPRGASMLGRFWSFPEINFCTYVLYREKPGILFFSLDAGSLLAVSGARLFYRLPYFQARMEISRSERAFHYRSRRLHGRAEFLAQYEPLSDVYRAAPGTLSHWLSERYCLYVVDGAQVFRGEIHHSPWPLQNAHAELERNTLPDQIGISLAATPDFLQFAAAEEVLIWPLRKA